MPPKARITKEHIVNAAVELVREKGFEALNARTLAAALSCSTQPIFSNYTSMEALHEDVIVTAAKIYDTYAAEEATRNVYPPYKASGMAYIRFASEEHELFRLLFMRPRTENEITKEVELYSHAIREAAESTGLSFRAETFHFEMWAFVHGIATMAVTHYLPLDEKTVSTILTDAYQGLLARHRKGESDERH